MRMRLSDLREKLITAASVVGAAMVVAAAIFVYERYYRATDAWFYGSWQGVSEGTSDAFYWQFLPDHTFSGFVLSRYDGEKLPFLKGRWYAGGPFLYLRVSGELGWPDPTVLRFD